MNRHTKQDQSQARLSYGLQAGGRPKVKKPIIILIAILSALVLIGCGSTKQVTQLVERTTLDTIYLSNIQYDSIYIYQDRSKEYHLNPLNHLKPSETDTLFIKDVSIEYRYKLLRDTVRINQRDSIPYEVTVTEVKEITRPLTWFDHLCRYSFFILLGAVMYCAYRLVRKFGIGI